MTMHAAFATLEPVVAHQSNATGRLLRAVDWRHLPPTSRIIDRGQRRGSVGEEAGPPLTQDRRCKCQSAAAEARCAELYAPRRQHFQIDRH